MRVRKNVFISLVLFFALAVAQMAAPSAAFAAGTVGSGTPGSCTEGALNAALAGGGAVNFDCGASPHTITITGTKVISSNTQIDGGGLITISGGDAFRVFTVDSGVTFTMTGLTVSDGSHTGNGGGLFIDSGAMVTISDSTFRDNSVEDGYGGAIYVNGATLHVSDSSFITNSADVTSLAPFSLGGGAIQNNDGTVEILGSTFDGNKVISPSADGGAIYNGDLDGVGNVPDANPDVMEIGNSTFHNNTLEGDTGTSGSSGGAIRSNGDITLAHNTFSDNDSGVTLGSGDEAGAVTFGHGTALVVYNIFANSTAFSGTAYDCAKRTGVTFTPVANMVMTDFSCAAVSNADPNLGPLQDNGGPTHTMAPIAPSLAINGGTNCVTDLTTDQRGVSRPQPAGVTDCDLGAVEVDTDDPTVTINEAVGQADPTNGSPVNFTVTFSEPVVGFTTGDVNLSASTVGGTLLGTVTGGPVIFNVAVTGMTTPGNIVATIDDSVLTDIALNGNDPSTSTDNSVTYDATGPTVTINQAAGQADPTNDSPINFTVVFNESVTGFTMADVTIGGTANPANKSVSGSGTTYNVAVSGMTNPGTVTASVNAGAVADALGNLSSASSSTDNTVDYDGTPPMVTSIERLDASPTNASSVEFLVTFSESVNGGSASNFSLTVSGITGHSITDVSGSGATRTVTVNTGNGNGTIRLNMANSAGVSDGAGNAVSGLPFNDEVYTVDKTTPTVISINRVGSSPTNAASVDFLVTFSESVSGGGTSNFALTTSGVSGASVDSVTGSGTTRTVTVDTGTGTGTIRLDLDNSAGLGDAAGNAVSNVPFTTGQSYSLDRTVPTVTINQKAGQDDPTNDAPIEFTVVFSEDVSGFTGGDLTLSSGTAIVTGGPATYTVSVNDMSEGALTATIPANAAADSAGNNNTASTSTDNSVTFDTTSPSVTINQKVGQNDPTNTSPIEFTVVFSESVTGFTSSDVLLSGTAADDASATVSGSGTTYNVAVTGMTQGGSVFASVAAGAATDTAQNQSLAATSSDNEVTYDPENATVTINQAGGQDDPTRFSPALFTVVFSKPVTGFETGDVSLDGTAGATTATVAEIAPNDGTTYEVVVTGMTSSGTAIVSIPADVAEDVASNGNLASTSVDNSVTFTFVKPGAPALTSPASGAIVSGLQPLLSWNNSNPGAQYYQIQVSTVKTFASTVFDESNIESLEFTPDSDLTPGVLYYWRVRGINAIGTVSNWSALRTFKTPLEAPVLSSPIGGAVLDTDRPTLEWDAVPGATSYQVQISTASNFSTGLSTKTVLDTPYPLPADLAQNRVLYWRVKAKTPAVASDWSVGESFQTGNPPTTTVLTAPASNALVPILNPLFTWRASTLPLPAGSTTFKHYQIQVADNADFNSPVIDKQVPDIKVPRYQAELADGLMANETYYWRVRAVNDVDLTAGEVLNFSAWSAGRMFRSAMQMPVLLLPDNTSVTVVPTRRPDFDWQDTAGATGYQISISQSANMSKSLLNANTTSSAYTPVKDLPANKTLFWRVRATGPNGPSLWSEIWTFTTGNPPSVPMLVSPADNALTTNFFPVFDWRNAAVPAGTFKHYEIEVDDDSGFGSPAINEPIVDLEDSRYLTQPTDILDPNTTYYWRVRAVSTIDAVDHTSSWSVARRLRLALAPPELVAPAHQGVVNDQPVFEWDPVAGATGYTIQVSTSPAFSGLILNVSISNGAASEYDPTKVLPVNKVIYWRVRANGPTTSAWSDAFEFTIVP